MRKVGIVIGVIVVVIVAALLIFSVTFDANHYRGTVQAELQKRLGRAVSLGDMHLGVFPPRFQVQNLAIADDPHFSSNSFVKAQELDVSIRLLPLLRKQVEIRSLNLERPSVNLIRNRQGVWNFASLGRPQGISSAPATAPQPEPGTQPVPAGQPSPTASPQAGAAQQFSLGELTIHDGQLSLLDQQTSKAPAVYDHIDVTLKDFAPNKPFTIDAAARMAGSSSQQVRLSGEGGPINQGQPALTPFHGTLSLNQVGTAELSKFLNSPALAGTSGILTGETKINTDSAKLIAQGQTNIQNPKIHGVDLGYPIAAQYDLTDDLPSDLITIRNLTLKLGSTPLQLNGTINAQPTPAQLNVNLKASNVSVAEAARLAAASGMALSKDTNVSGSVNMNVQARGAADKPTLNGTITAANLRLSGNGIAQPVTIPAINLNLTPSQIQSSPFNVSSGGTTLNAQLNVRNYTATTPIVDATVRAPNAQLPAILSMAKAYAVGGLDKVTGSGVLNLDLHASGPVSSLDSAGLMRALNGTMDLNFNNVKYSGANIGRELSSIAGFLNANAAAQSTEGITNILKMTGNILVRNGIAQTNNLQAQLDIGTLAAAGTANLVNQALNMRVTAVLSQAVSQKAGGNSIGGFMKTALANNQGELVIPALVAGTFSNPKFAPDLQQVAQMKLKGLIPNLNNPGSLTGALQNLLGGAKQPAPGNNAAEPGQPQPKQNPVQQIMGIFGRKKDQQKK